MEGVKISIVVPTYNGAHKIERLIKSLLIQDFNEFELIAVIDGSIDSTYEILQRLKLPFPIHIINQKNQGRSVSRNNGAKVAQGEIICFFDDDMVLESNCLSVHYNYQMKLPGAIIVGPTIEQLETKRTDFQRYKCKVNHVVLQELMKVKSPFNKTNLFLSAANLSMRKETFFEVGGFDERLSDSEDYEFGVRAFEKGKPIYYKHDAIGYHEEFVTCKSFIKRQREYFKAQEVLMKINPEADKYFKAYNKQEKIKDLLYYILSNKWFVYLIDNFNIFKVIPSSLRYRLYSAIVWGLATKFPQRSV